MKGLNLMETACNRGNKGATTLEYYQEFNHVISVCCVYKKISTDGSTENVILFGNYV